jgi:hypothetical protein
MTRESQMRRTITRLLSAALVAISFHAFAGLVPLPGALDPGVPDTGFFNEQACPTPQTCPVNSGSINGHDDILFDIINTNGIMNISFNSSITPSTGGFFSFVYTVFNPAAIPISSGLPQSPPDFAVAIGSGYNISLDWTLTANPGTGPQSANFSLLATTAPDLRVPEPMTLALIGIGLAALGFVGRRKL